MTFQNSIPDMGKKFAPMLRPKGILPALTFVLALSIGTAWSYDGTYKPNSTDVSRETLQQNNKHPSSVSSEPCLSLLNTNKTQVNSVENGNQRAVGQVAALGIILGARFALEPKNEYAGLHTEKTADRLQIDEDKRTAHAIVNYRQCLKQTALNRTAKNEV